MGLRFESKLSVSKVSLSVFLLYRAAPLEHEKSENFRGTAALRWSPCALNKDAGVGSVVSLKPVWVVIAGGEVR